MLSLAFRIVNYRAAGLATSGELCKSEKAGYIVFFLSFRISTSLRCDTHDKQLIISLVEDWKYALFFYTISLLFFRVSRSVHRNCHLTLEESRAFFFCTSLHM